MPAKQSTPWLDAGNRRALVAAIGAAEQRNRGEVRVHLEARCPGPDALARARQLFGQLEMHKTRDATGVLLYVAVSDRKAAVFAGDGIYGAAEPAFWKTAVDKVAAGFRDGRPREGLVAALGAIGDLLRKAVPGDDRAGTELPNEVSTS